MIVSVSFTTRSLIVTISSYYTIPIEYRKPTWNWYDLLLCPTNFRFTAGLNRKIAMDKEIYLYYSYSSNLLSIIDNIIIPLLCPLHVKLLCWEVAPHKAIAQLKLSCGRIVSKIWSVWFVCLPFLTERKWRSLAETGPGAITKEIWNGTLPLHSDGTAVWCFVDSCDWF